MEDILAITFIFGGLSAFLLAISPVGKALADRIRGAGPRGSDAGVQQVRESQMVILDELEALRQELTEVQERLDFTERIIARQREAERLPPGSNQA